jgi:CO/xanthine dehydrogenase Mo-binding subunit
VQALTRAIHTNNPNCGAFRGFGVPQATLLNELLIDRLAQRLGRDPLDLRLDNALRAGDVTPTGQRLDDSVGLVACLQALKPAWEQARRQAERYNDRAAVESSPFRRGVGIACMWYGIGNTVIANPSSMTIGLRRNGRVVLYNGAIDIGQGTYTIMPQIAADALGLPLSLFDQVLADTDLTRDAGKSSASRQTFVSGNAARLAAEDLRRQLLALLDLPAHALLRIEDGRLGGEVEVDGERRQRWIELNELPANAQGDVATDAGASAGPRRGVCRMEEAGGGARGVHPASSSPSSASASHVVLT